MLSEVGLCSEPIRNPHITARKKHSPRRLEGSPRHQCYKKAQFVEWDTSYIENNRGDVHVQRPRREEKGVPSRFLAYLRQRFEVKEFTLRAVTMSERKAGECDAFKRMAYLWAFPTILFHPKEGQGQEVFNTDRASTRSGIITHPSMV